MKKPENRGEGEEGEEGYVTVEAAVVFTALTAVVGMVVAGVVTVASYLGAVDLARDAARAASLDPANAEAVVADLVGKVDSQARASVTVTDTVTVRVTRPGRLFNLTATAVTVPEPVVPAPGVPTGVTGR
ncbi:hypothetical protein [Corynebacterium neomassiliense]|uniref:hypothetical protein n=1 Tax=Corynebacterium neomassiliense TaxID=2079482 RepID=UPI001F218D44|nr:hypothetical protein [Corynebacterium neomassiliense]